MKRIFIAILICLSTPSIFSQPYDFTGLDFQSKAVVDNAFDEFGKAFGQGINGSMGHLMNMDFLKFGASGMFIPKDRTGVFQNSTGDFLSVETIYAGISLFRFNLVGRFGVVPEGGQMFAGGALGYQIPVHPLVTVQPFITYNQSINFNRITRITAYSFQVQVKGNFEAFNPYATTGLSYTNYETDIVLDDNTFYTHSRFLFHSTLGVRIMFFFYELSITPIKSHSVGVTIDF